jgi:hypothetical protein
MEKNDLKSFRAGLHSSAPETPWKRPAWRFHRRTRVGWQSLCAPSRLRVSGGRQSGASSDTINPCISRSGSNLVDKRRRALRATIHDRNRQVMTLKALLETIGLDRLPKPVEPLKDYLKRRVPSSREGEGGDEEGS